MGILKRNTKKADDTKKVLQAPVEKKKELHTEAIVIPAPHKRILLGAHVSEKAASVEATGTFTFRVTLNATKGDVKQAIRKHYGVLPVSVRMINVEGKNVRFGQYFGKRKDWKKAIVTLPKGTHIDIHSGI
ncbi:MAG: 50S ribosomal protein L23 [Candidatus Magasanikbacteria bacterium CG10_big_fil_rev_8_21_14_0_10_42_10]|uniref:Large ribosomal subunit protein uL23 n=2 Tax=Candidatus Magasanikiibacteriota TaxID=1752731 RepID=A0A2H0TVC0_9BACT|nr:MAG: 50S ribosomal protein L23 [Candidatus Magasanikbacteria bacterium CG10_big_fil_rev_8_21_14_0_10_42_10]PIZ94303.1 MAG: 50S ribosomal protein L23 [Candidatus Magasanikbacteria bacterium CG_4_10_14_0_2_um_filter_41_10]